MCLAVSLAGLALADTNPETDDWIIQWAEIAALGEKGTPQAMETLESIVNGKEADWRRGRALVTLAGMEGAGFASHARQWLSSSSSVLRAAACEALGLSGGDEKMLRRALKDPDESTRWQAAIGLARTKGGDVEMELGPFLVDPASNTVARQVTLLSALRTDSALGVLTNLARHKDTGIRRRAIQSMHGVEDNRIVPVLVAGAVRDRSSEIRKIARGVVYSYAPAFLGDPIARMLRKSDSATRTFLLELLFYRSSRAGADAVATMLRTGEPPLADQTRLLAMDTLLAIDPQGYRDIFVGHLEDKAPSLRMRALLALSAGVPEAELFKLLAPAMVDANWTVFSRALGLLKGRTEGVPEGGLVPYLGPSLRTNDTQRLGALLGFMKQRLPPTELDAALEPLDPFLGGTNVFLRERAAELYTLATDDVLFRKAAAAQGYLTQWMVIGPFDNDRYNKGHDTVYPPEKEVDFRQSYVGAFGPTRLVDEITAAETGPSTNEAIRVKWQGWPIVDLDAKLRFHRVLLGLADFLVSYAVAEVVSPDEQPVTFHIEADDTYKFWLNGELVLSATNAPVTEEIVNNRDKWMALARNWNKNSQKHSLKGTLREGRNRLMFKVCNFTDHWFVRVRVVNTRGARAEMEEIEVRHEVSLD
jgi:HEAT repeat protein